MYQIEFKESVIFSLAASSNSYDNAQLLLTAFTKHLYLLSDLFNSYIDVSFQQLYWDEDNVLQLKIRVVINEVVNILDVSFIAIA